MQNESADKSPGNARRHRVQEYVRWSDVDVSGIIGWGAYVRFVELAETELFRAAGFPYATLWDRLDIWLPRVQFHLDYRNPARLDELLDIEIWVGRIGRSSIRLEFAVRNPGGDLTAEGRLVIVSVDRTKGWSVDVPKPLLDALAPYTTSTPTSPPTSPQPSTPQGGTEKSPPGLTPPLSTSGEGGKVKMRRGR
jgi:acyl-CoA thioester hydrolase